MQLSFHFPGHALLRNVAPFVVCLPVPNAAAADRLSAAAEDRRARSRRAAYSAAVHTGRLPRLGGRRAAIKRLKLKVDPDAISRRLAPHPEQRPVSAAAFLLHQRPGFWDRPAEAIPHRAVIAAAAAATVKLRCRSRRPVKRDIASATVPALRR